MNMNLAAFLQSRDHIYVEINMYRVSQYLNPQPNPRFNYPEREIVEKKL